jgi:hypothetical protein
MLGLFLVGAAAVGGLSDLERERSTAESIKNIEKLLAERLPEPPFETFYEEYLRTRQGWIDFLKERNLQYGDDVLERFMGPKVEDPRCPKAPPRPHAPSFPGMNL